MDRQSFSIRTNFDEFQNDEVDATLISQIINSFSPNEWDFLVLSPELPIQDSTFLQAGSPEEMVDFQYTLEIGFYNENNGRAIYRLYTKDKNVVMEYLIDYWQEGKIPDLLLWEDVSQEINDI
ncbi:MAG: hypothetical protein FWG10_14055 [Eubacteriaceae bacterium]|nr:hypothetical protein [Eubacteriaceae bacterium]